MKKETKKKVREFKAKQIDVYGDYLVLVTDSGEVFYKNKIEGNDWTLMPLPQYHV